MIPDSIVIRLRNLIALDPDGNDLHIGSEPLILHKNQITASLSPLDNQFLVYPNPARDLLYVDSPADISGEILNLQAQIIRGVYLKNNSLIDVSDYSPGVNLLRISGSSHTYEVVIY